MLTDGNKVGLRDIAREANLSVSAVSMALAGYPDISVATRMRVREIGMRLNYKANRGRKSASHRAAAASKLRRICLIAVGYPAEPAYLPPLLRFLTHCEGIGNFKVEIAQIPPGPLANQVQRLDEISSGLDGLLIDGFVRSTLFEHAAALPIPAVVIGNVVGDPMQQQLRGYQVGVDTRGMGQLATRKLIEAGHRRIAFLSLPFVQNLWYEQWYQGYRHAHVEAGLSCDARLVKIVADDATADGSKAAAAELLALGDLPTGYVVAVPTIASQILTTMSAAGRAIAAQDIVIGATLAGARALGLEHHPLISGHHGRLSRAALELLLRAMDGPPPEPCKVLVPFDTWNMPGATRPKVVSGGAGAG